MASALQFLANLGYIHGDIKPANILINKNGIIKICDLGMCGQLNENGVVEGDTVGTNEYFAPELVDMEENQRSIQSDMWATGITALEVAMGKHPFPGVNEFQLYSLMQKWTPEVPNTIQSEPMKELILSL